MKGKGKIHQNSKDVRPNCRVIGLHRHTTAPAVHFYSVFFNYGQRRGTLCIGTILSWGSSWIGVKFDFLQRKQTITQIHSLSFSKKFPATLIPAVPFSIITTTAFHSTFYPLLF